MDQATSRTGSTFADSGNSVVVRRPRPTDAVGGALRQAFMTEQGLPGELARTLIVLDRGR